MKQSSMPTRLMGQHGKPSSPTQSRLTHIAIVVFSHSTQRRPEPKVLNLPESDYRKTPRYQMTVTLCAGPAKAAEQLLLPSLFWLLFVAMTKSDKTIKNYNQNKPRRISRLKPLTC